jgi:hypothetical protein
MNLAIGECVERAASGQPNNTGMVVMWGNAISMLKALEESLSNGCLAKKSMSPLQTACFTIK